jgi:aspartokinase
VRTLDLLWSTGELRSVAILTLHLQVIWVSAVGLNVHRAGLRFLAEAQARPALRRVPGFLATRSDEAIVTLGRGGSDLSAVLLAVGLGVARCELVQPRALVAAANTGLPLVVRSLDEDAPSSVISPGTKQTSADT